MKIRKINDTTCDAVTSQKHPVIAQIINDLVTVVVQKGEDVTPPISIEITNDHLFKVSLGKYFIPDFFLLEYDGIIPEDLPPYEKEELHSWQDLCQERAGKVGGYQGQLAFLDEKPPSKPRLKGIFVVVQQSHFHDNGRSREFMEAVYPNSALRVSNAEEVIKALLLFWEERVEKEMSLPRNIREATETMRQFLLPNS